MICAYDRLYVDQVQKSLGNMFDFAVYELKHTLTEFWRFFVHSTYSERIESGDVAIVAGRSGILVRLGIGILSVAMWRKFRNACRRIGYFRIAEFV